MYKIEDFKDIIFQTKFTAYNYQRIKFDEFIFRITNSNEKFIENFTSIDYINKIFQKFSLELNESFSKHGELKLLDISDLFFYQKDCGIEGPKNNKIDTPVYVIQEHDKFILLNGYHRFFTNVMQGKKNIKCGLMDKIVPNFYMFCSSGQNSSYIFLLILFSKLNLYYF